MIYHINPKYWGEGGSSGVEGFDKAPAEAAILNLGAYCAVCMHDIFKGLTLSIGHFSYKYFLEKLPKKLWCAQHKVSRSNCLDQRISPFIACHSCRLFSSLGDGDEANNVIRF